MIFAELKELQDKINTLVAEQAQEPKGLKIMIHKQSMKDKITTEHVERFSPVWEILLLGRSGESFEVTKTQANRFATLRRFGVQYESIRGMTGFRKLTFVPKDIMERLRSTAVLEGNKVEYKMMHRGANPEWQINKDTVCI